jgi:hypothetical protein
VGTFLFRDEGGKKSLQKKNAVILFSPVIIVGTALSLLPKPVDTSFVGHTAKDLTNLIGDALTGTTPSADGDHPKGINGELANGQAQTRKARQNDYGVSPIDGAGGGRRGIKYHAVQIVQRQGGDPSKTLPMGTSLIGRLLTGIDTREPNSLARVLVPYGGSFDHERHIDKNSILFGNVAYSGSGERVYIKFTRFLSPDGKEFKVDAQALSSADYSPGLSGEENDGAGSRLAGTVGLTMFSGMTDALTNKQALTEFGDVSAKPTLRDGFYNGLAKSTNQEAQRRAAKMNDAKDYVTIPAGLDLIVSLTETFKGEGL